MAVNFYQLLGLEQSADIDSLKRSYRQLAKTYHPDRNASDPYAKELFQKVNEAYAVLSDPVTRGRYDDFLAAKQQQLQGSYRHQTSTQVDRQVDRHSVFDTLLDFTIDKDTEVCNGVVTEAFFEGSSPPPVPLLASKSSFKLSQLPLSHYLCLILIATIFMFFPSQGGRLAFALVWLFFMVHALLSSWWINKNRFKFPSDELASGGLVLMTHVISASLSMVFLLPLILVIYYMN